MAGPLVDFIQLLFRKQFLEYLNVESSFLDLVDYASFLLQGLSSLLHGTLPSIQLTADKFAWQYELDAAVSGVLYFVHGQVGCTIRVACILDPVMAVGLAELEQSRYKIVLKVIVVENGQ